MAPYCDKSSLPTDSNDSISAIPTQVLPESPSLSTPSEATTPSLSPQEVIPTESFVDIVYNEEDSRRILAGATPCYPTSGDIMPYDHSLPDFIRQITNQPNLENLQSLSLRVISTLISLHRMSTYLPNLRELDLEGSVLNSLRDIGCNFKNLQILKVGRCQLESLDGTFGLTSLRELYAQKNLINDITPCSNLPHIRHIDMSGNRIRNISYVGFLSVCSKLRSIVFTGNPAAVVPDYRKHVRRILPQLETLDGVPFFNEDNAEEADLLESMCELSEVGSTELPDIIPLSPSESLSNFLETEEEPFLLKKTNKHAKNVANKDQFEATDYEVQEVLSNHDLQDELAQGKGRRGISEQAKMIENRHIRQKCMSIQKQDKDIENRSKRSNLSLKANFIDGLISETSSVRTKSVVASTSNSQIKNDSNDPSNLENRSSGAMKFKSVTRIPELTISDVAEAQEVSRVNDESKLNKGLPVCGNLTAALRNRKKHEAEKNPSKLHDIQTSGLEAGADLRVQVNGSGDNLDLDTVIENENDFIAEDVLECSQKWRETFRRYRSNNRSTWEEEEEEKKQADSTKSLEDLSKLD